MKFSKLAFAPRLCTLHPMCRVESCWNIHCGLPKCCWAQESTKTSMMSRRSGYTSWIKFTPSTKFKGRFRRCRLRPNHAYFWRCSTLAELTCRPDPDVFATVSLLHDEQLPVCEQCSHLPATGGPHHVLAASIEPFALALVHQVMDIMELVGLESEFLFGFSMQWCEADTGIKGVFLNRPSNLELQTPLALTRSKGS